MKPVEVVIETRTDPVGGFRAQVARAPKWVYRYAELGKTREDALARVRADLGDAYPRRPFDFKHVEA